MLTVGLTGGIGAGKSAVVRMLSERGAVIVDSDRIAREVVAPGTPGLAAVVEEFGPEVLTPGGELDRARLGAIVFADEARRRALNAIVHPLVAERAARLREAAAEDDIVVNDVPLLAENGLETLYDVVVVVDAAAETQLDRLVRLRGMDASDARARMAAQATREQRLAVADIVVDNNGSLDRLRDQVAQMWDRLCEKAARG